MALFSRFFSPRRSQKKETNVHQILRNKNSLRSSFTIERDNVRVLLFRECDWRGRKLLFDSSCVQKISVNNLQLTGGRPRSNSKDLIFEISNGFGYQYTKPSRDATSLGETVFGSVALSQRRSSIKVHLLNSPRRLMLSSVIHSPHPNRKRQISDRSLDDSYGSSINSMSDYFSGISSDVKSSDFSIDFQDFSLEHSVGNCDSLSYCPIHCSSLTPNCNSANSSSSNQSGGSLTSLRRRWLRSVTTSMNLDSLHNLIDMDSSQTIESNSSTESTQNSQVSTHKRTKLGIAIIIKLQESHENGMEEYLLQRIPLLVHLVTRLQQNSERAYAHKDSFVQLMMETTADAAQALYDILCGTCIEKPVWLTLTSYYSQNNVQCQNEILYKLVKDLGYLLQTIDTKHTNFFMSTLLTAVLTHHLGWVPTVVPDEGKDMSNKRNNHDMLSALSQSHPYNPLWAQLSDLQGALGFPPKVVKTIIIGQSEVLISKVLSVLSYFIRCGQIFYTPEERLEDPSEDCLLEAIINSKLNPSENEISNKNDLVDIQQQDSQTIMCHSTNTSLSKRKNFCHLNSLNETNNSSESDLKNYELNLTCNNRPSNLNSVKSGNLNNNLLKSPGLKQTTDAKLKKHCNNIIIDKIYENDLNPDVISDKVTKLCRVPKSAVLYHLEDDVEKNQAVEKGVAVFEKNNHSFVNYPKRIESEKQMASVDIKNHINNRLFKKDEKVSFFNEDILADKNNEKTDKCNSNVIFVLGENEELVGLNNNINNGDNNKLENLNNDDNVDLNIITPKICVDNYNDDVDKSQSCISQNKTVLNNIDDGERSKTTYIDKNDNNCKKTGLVDEECNSRSKILVFKSTPIDLLQDCNKLSPSISSPPQRCLSIPDEAMLVTDEIKEKRSRETIEIIRRWLSDSEIYSDKHKQFLKHSNSATINKGNIAKTKNSSEIINNVITDRTSDNNTVDLILPNNSDCDLCARTTAEAENSDSVEVEKDSYSCFKENQSDVASDNIHLPLPNSKRDDDGEIEICLAKSLLGGVSDHYIPSLILQGILEDGNTSHPTWESELRRDLQIEVHSPVLNQEISEAVCIIANVDTWEVQLVSSHTLIVEKILEGRCIGVRVGMSQLVANMLETVLNLYKLSIHPKHCVSHIEAKLGEFWLRSIALSEMLISTEFLDMATLTTALDLDPNDVPLLLSVASIHNPQVTKKYGLSFQ
ncbi:folliculin-interacting protein 1 [Lycorma delicatula]|uniref:folliculin-interacting protein 1 n=1 Tax=Lycorma delicatula TaxID=130591 RepID=UPI003F5172B6